MITIMNLIDTGGPGGAETVFLQTATRLDPARFRAVAAVSREGWLAEQLRAAGVEPLIIPASGSLHVRYLQTLVRTIRRHHADVVAAHLYGTAVYASVAGQLAGVPTVAILHGQSDVASGGRLDALKAAIVRRGARKVVFVSNNLRVDLAARLRLDAKRCEVIPNGIDTSVFRPGRENSLRVTLGIPDDAILVGAIGNARPAKGYDVLLQAAAILVSRCARFHFVIAGDTAGTLGRELLQLRDRLGLSSRVNFLGLRSDVAAVMRNLDVFALSSRTEGFSIACIEAMASELPVVATRSGGPQEILDDRCGVLVAPGDPGALADAICQVALTDGLGATLGAAGRKRVQEEYSLATMLARYETLLTQVAGTSEVAPHATT
jgi:glycosyltransferase involved in cell wall biosynthesis